MEQIHLISFKLCPFVQRSVITLLHKNIDFDITYIDLDDRPSWFNEMSPLGKVPVLKYGETVLFESAVINEFLDEITPPQIVPSDPLLKAQQRSWIEFTSQVFTSQFLTGIADNQADFESRERGLLESLKTLENTKKNGRYFFGDDFTLLDAAISPLFTRFEVQQAEFGRDYLSSSPKLRELGEQYLSMASVRKSVVDDFSDIYVDYLKRRNSVLAN